MRVDFSDIMPVLEKVKVLKVLDGDTLEIKLFSRVERLRLTPIDAPEKSQYSLIGHHPAGSLSSMALRKMIESEKEWIVSVEGRDIYGRFLGDLKNHQGQSLSLKLLQEGWVSLYPFARFKTISERDFYLFELNRAQELKKGLWKWGGYERPYSYRKKSRKLSGHP